METGPYPVKFLLVHPDGYDYAQLIGDTLAATYDEEEETTLRSRIQTHYTWPCVDGHVLSGLTVIFFGSEGEARAAVEDVSGALHAAAQSRDDGLRHALKFSDPLVLSEILARVPFFFDMEMRLREALSVALLSQHTDFYQLIKAAEAKAQPKGAPTGKERVTLLSEALQNELFYLDLSGYHDVTQRKEGASEFVLRSARDAGDFSEFQQLLEEGPIRGKPFNTVVGLLNGPLRDVAAVRNSVAHNRAASNEEGQRFQAIRGGIETSLTEFFDQLQEVPEPEAPPVPPAAELVPEPAQIPGGASTTSRVEFFAELAAEFVRRVLCRPER